MKGQPMNRSAMFTALGSHYRNLPPGVAPSPLRPQAGFTLLELIVVMGILTGFLIMLVQLVDAGLRLFGEGELTQALADRSSRAQRILDAELRSLRGSSSARDRDAVDDRLLVQWLPIGLPAQPEIRASHVQVLRGAVHLTPARELPLLEAMVTARILREQPELSPAELGAAVTAAMASEPLRGVGNLLLLPWRQEGKDEALVELRAGWLLPGQMVPLQRDEWVDPFAVPVPGSAQLPATLVDQLTTPLLRDLLHVEFQFWSQRTQQWRPVTALTNAPSPAATLFTGGSGPERIWDSARGGLLVDAQSGGQWALDRGPASLRDPNDDIHPHAIHVFVVVAQPGELAAEGLLAGSIEADDDVAVLVQGDRFPGPATAGWIKLRGEWMQYSERSGDRLLGLRRGQRATKALSHPYGTRVHVGRTVEFLVPLPHAKDDWNG